MKTSEKHQACLISAPLFLCELPTIADIPGAKLSMLRKETPEKGVVYRKIYKSPHTSSKLFVKTLTNAHHTIQIPFCSLIPAYQTTQTFFF